MKKMFVIILACFITLNFGGYNFVPKSQALAEEKSLEQQLEESTAKELDSLDLSDLEQLYTSSGASEDMSIYDYIKSLINGERVLSFDSLIDLLLGKVKSSLLSTIKLMLEIIIVGFISSLLSNLSSGKQMGVSLTITMVFSILVATILLVDISKSISSVIFSISRINKTTEVLCPILLALMVSLGFTTLGAVYEPMVAVLTTIFIKIFSGVVVGAIVIELVLTVAGSISPRFKLEKFVGFFRSFTKWAMGGIFAIFIGYLTVAGITTGGKDGLSIKTAKYAIRNYVPVVGGYITDEFEIFKVGSLLIKNSVGVVGLVILFSIVISPAVLLIVKSLLLKYAGGIIEISGANALSNLLSRLSKIYISLFAVLASVFMMAFIFILLVIMSANVVS